ncbi:MAG: hypothetical protein ACE1ZF_01410 [Gemmatimonadales bacterium]
MTSSVPHNVGYPVATPGVGAGWAMVAKALEEIMAPDDIVRIWIFPPLRGDGREWGTAVVATGAKVERFTVHTAKYMLNTRGRHRGRGKVELDEVGEGPVDVVLDVVAGVQSRTGDGEPPVEIDPELWFAQEEDDESTTEA